MSLRIVKIYGPYGLQGLPEPGRRRFGVPPGGAFDQESYRLANALVGNSGGELCLELGLATGDFVAETPLRLSVVGCDVKLDGERIESGGAFDVDPGQPLHIELPKGARAYIAVSGGWAARKDDHLEASTRSSNLKPGRMDYEPDSLRGRPLRVLQGPDGDDSTMEELLASTARVSHRLDRIGIRLDTDVREWPSGTSTPCCEGVIQGTRDGSLIVFGPDGPTVGGYAKIAVVARIDWSRLGQLRPGDDVQFEVVTLERALDLWLQSEAILNQRCAAVSARA